MTFQTEGLIQGCHHHHDVGNLHIRLDVSLILEPRLERRVVCGINRERHVVLRLFFLENVFFILFFFILLFILTGGAEECRLVKWWWMSVVHDEPQQQQQQRRIDARIKLFAKTQQQQTLLQQQQRIELYFNLFAQAQHNNNRLDSCERLVNSRRIG